MVYVSESKPTTAMANLGYHPAYAPAFRAMGTCSLTAAATAHASAPVHRTSDRARRLATGAKPGSGRITTILFWGGRRQYAP